jgi:UDP-N-acetylmuramate dehydrogenase
MKTSHQVSLKPYNTFGVDVKARDLVTIDNEDELRNLVRQVYADELFIISGGSNMLLTRDLDKTVVLINNKGIKVHQETEDYVLVDVEAGENWHELVLWAVYHGYGGIENLALIPGCVGTSPIQNIGAYGVELKDTFLQCEAIQVQTGEKRFFTNAECQFGYRDSIFKNELANQYIITRVRFKLEKQPHNVRSDYRSLKNYLKEKNISDPGIEDIANAVTEIRRSKLPDPDKIGNSGSFFKNPVVDDRKFKTLQERYPEIPHFKQSDHEVKVPAGWLIEQCGFKGYRKGDAGVHEKQALVLVNHGKASGQEILELSKNIRRDVKEKFNITLSREVNVF